MSFNPLICKFNEWTVFLLRKISKIVISALVTALLGSLCLPSSLAATTGTLTNFKKSHTYSATMFSDVKTGGWATTYIQTAFEYGLMNGVGASTFEPDGNLTMASTLAIADRIHDTYYSNNTDFTAKAGASWYQPYLDYAYTNGILAGTADFDAAANCSRAQFVALIANALPRAEFSQKNYIQSLPDVSKDNDAYSDIIMFYRAGVLAGNDKYGTFTPDSSITRGAIAAILIRIINPDSRLTTALDIKADTMTLNTEKLDTPWLSIGETYTIKPNLTPSITTEKPQWTSSDNSIATVKDGVVTALKEGEVSITATLPSGLKDTMYFYVESDVALANVSIKALKEAIVRLPDITVDTLVIKSATVGQYVLYGESHIIVCLTYGSTTSLVTKPFLVWHVSRDLADGYYYDYSRGSLNTPMLFTNSRDIDINSLDY